MKKILALLCLAVAFVQTTTAAGYLFQNGRTSYKIVLPSNASSSEKTAANELQAYLKDISGATLPVTTTAPTTGKAIYVGYSNKLAQLTGATKPDKDDNGYTYRTVNDNLCIWGGSQKGTMFGVYAFLCDQLGVRFYTVNYTKLPTRKAWTLPTLNVSSSPAFKYRHILYHTPHINHDWAAHNGLNMTMGNYSKDNYGDRQAIWGVHTFGELISTDEFFASHPEYFSLRSGKRQKELTQLCLSNQNVIKLLKQRMLKAIAQNPGNIAYSLSQNDNFNPCECSKCKAIEEKYGGHSGLILWAVNQVADEVKKQYPGVFLITFAYHYTQSAPRNIKPRDNVLIRLCDIEMCFSHPMTDSENKAFVTDITNWSKLTDHLFIWDYVTDFSGYYLPFPNFKAEAANLKKFKDFGVWGIMTQGQYQNYGGEFYELRQWVLAQLLWNPDQDYTALVKDFITDYYGAAAPYIQQYFDLEQSLATSGHHLYVNTTSADAMYSTAFLTKARSLLSTAASKVKKDATLSDRVESVRAQIYYLDSQQSRSRAASNGSLKGFVKFLQKEKPNVTENQTATQFLQAVTGI